MQFRKHGKPNPFQAAKRNINNKLYSIQEKILLKFTQGQQREFMRRTIRQLLQNETSIQNKIKVLLSMVDSYQYRQADIIQNQSVQDKCRSIQYYSNPTHQREQSHKSYKDRYSPNRSSNELIQSFENKRFYTDNEQFSEKSDIFYSRSQKTPYSIISNKNEPLDFQYSQQKQSNLDKQMENNIFSFRTQNQNKSPKHQQMSKKASIKHSQNNEQQNEKDAHKKVRNYDGYSHAYIPANASLLSNSTIYQKISNRLKYSPCIINKIHLSTSSTSTNALHNRFKLQQQHRTSLINSLTTLFPK